MNNLAEIIRQGCVLFNQARKDKKYYQNDKYILAISDNVYKSMYSQIHSYLVPMHNDSGEKEIRQHIDFICNYIIPTLRDKIKRTSEKIKNVQRQKSSEGKDEMQQALYETYKAYCSIYEDFFALSCFRNLENFAMYMEWGMPEQDKIWKYNLNCFKGFWYYANKMVLDGTVKYIEKQCPTGYGKCRLPSDIVYTQNGRVQLKDVKIGDKILSMSNNSAVYNTVTNKWFSKKPQIKITTRGGHIEILSPEHRHFTQRGYVEAKDLTVNDYVYRLLTPMQTLNATPIDSDELFFVSCMLFEGHTKKYLLRFTQQKNKVFDKFIRLLDKKGWSYSVGQKKNAFEVRIHHNAGEPYEILKKYGISDCLAINKTLPKQFFNLPLNQKYDFLSIMFSTDGYLPHYGGKGGNQCGITLGSEKLIDDLQSFMNGCGIYSTKHKKQVKLNNKVFNSWSLLIPDEYFNVLYKNCYFYHKQKLADERNKILSNLSTKPYCICTNYPKELFCNEKGFKKLVNKSWSRNKTFKRELVERYSKATNELTNIVYKDFVWEKIKSVEYIEDCVDMIDIEVSNSHNFVCNDYVTHNSYSDTVLIAYIFGCDYNTDVLKVVGNPSIVADTTEKLVKYMCKPNYAKVFPYYAQFECDQNKMFDICRKGGNNQSAKLLIHGSLKGTSFLMVNKDTAVDGGRFKYRFYDDITRSKDKGNVKMHEKDIAKYNDQWKKRSYDDNNNFEIFGGTTYHIYDFLSTIKRLYGGEEATQSKVNRYTKFNKKWKSVFISVPKLDYETDESTYPHKYTTESARNDRKHNYETFMAMDMQMPMPIEGCPFSYDNIQCYDTIPHKDKEEECCYAMLDPARTGANYVAMTICLPIDGKHYLKDCIFVMQPMDKVYSRIINKIEQHHITHLLIEKNTDTSLKTLLDDMLHKRGIFFCKIEEIYSYKKKEDKIYDNEQTIKSYIVFPRFEDYAQGSEMGKYMKYIISFSYTEPNLYDDSPDSLAMYCQHFISSRKIKNEIKFIKRKK